MDKVNKTTYVSSNMRHHGDTEWKVYNKLRDSEVAIASTLVNKLNSEGLTYIYP